MLTLAVAVLSSPLPPPAVSIPAPTPEAIALHWGSNALWIVNQILAVGLPLLVIASGLNVRMRDLVTRVARGHRTLAAALKAVGLLGLFAVVRLPLSVYQSYGRMHAYGLSNQPFPRWLSHWGMSLGIELVIAAIVAGVLYALLRRFPRRWWLAAGLLALPCMLLGALVMPVLIDPLFHKQARLSDPVLESCILSLAHRSGIEADRVFEEDQSRDTKVLNAYVKGLLHTHRIVLWDTLLSRMDERQILFVMAHEMGHYVLGHVVQGIVMATGLILIGLALLHFLSGYAIRRWGPKFGISGLTDLAAMPLLLALAQLIALVFAPAGYAYSRHMEHEADRFALELTQDNHAGASAFQTFQAENLGVPRPAPLYRVWRASHPCLADRITFCNTYRPWAEGRPPRYASRFRPEPESAR